MYICSFGEYFNTIGILSIMQDVSNKAKMNKTVDENKGNTPYPEQRKSMPQHLLIEKWNMHTTKMPFPDL